MINILYFFKERETPMYLWQRYHIIDDLQRHGCRVTIFNPLKFDSVEHANESLIKEIETVPYDLFMTPHNEHDIHISTIDRIKSKGIPTLLICFDNLTVPHMHKTICKYLIKQYTTESINYKCQIAQSLCNALNKKEEE